MPSPSRIARILVLSEGRIPSAELGVEAVLSHEAAAGRCALRCGDSRRPRRRDLAWADSVVLVRGASPADLRLLREARRLGRRVATYVDDDLERVPPTARSGAFYGSPAVKASVASVLREADEVFACNGRLARVLEARHGRRPTILPQPRPPAPGAPEPAPEPAATAPVRIGFFGSVDHARFLEELLAGPLGRLRRERGRDVELVFCGAVPSFALALGAETHPFELGLEAWRRRAASLAVAIGLAPLPATPFHACKYWNKFLEYGSLGIAAVYSAVPPYTDAVEDGVTGLLRPNRSDAWYDAIVELVDDAGRREELGRNARAAVERRFAPAALAPRWREALGPLLDHRAPEVPAERVRLAGGRLRFLADRLRVYGPLGAAGRALGRLSGRLRPG